MDSPGYSPLDKETVLKALGQLDKRFEAKGVIGEICIFGGTAMMLAFGVRSSTHDVDAIFEPPELFRSFATEVADELGLEADWLNDGVKGFISAAPDYTTRAYRGCRTCESSGRQQSICWP